MFSYGVDKYHKVLGTVFILKFPENKLLILQGQDNEGGYQLHYHIMEVCKGQQGIAAPVTHKLVCSVA